MAAETKSPRRRRASLEWSQSQTISRLSGLEAPGLGLSPAPTVSYGRSVRAPRAGGQALKEKSDAKVDVSYPYRAHALGHYDVPIVLKTGASRIPHAGDGCFAGQHIPGPDYLVGYYGGPRARLLNHDTFKQMVAAEQQKCIPVFYGSSEPLYIWPETGPTSEFKHPTFLINHISPMAEDGKLVNVRITIEGAVITTRTIKSGEELYADYGLGYWVDHLIMEKAQRPALTDDEMRQIYMQGFPWDPASLVWEAVRRFYANPGFEKQHTVLCTDTLFRLMMDYIVDTYVVVQSTPSSLDKRTVMSMPRYAFITADTSIEEIDKLFEGKASISRKNTEQINNKRTRYMNYQTAADEAAAAATTTAKRKGARVPAASAAELRAKADDAKQKLELYLVRAAFELDLRVNFLSGEERFSLTRIGDLMPNYLWHGLADMTLKKVFELAHNPVNVKAMALMMAHLTGVWNSPEKLDQYGADLLPTLRSLTPGSLGELLGDGRENDDGTDIVTMPLFPFNLNLDQEKEGVPGESRGSDGTVNASASNASSRADEAKADRATAQVRMDRESLFVPAPREDTEFTPPDPLADVGAAISAGSTEVKADELPDPAKADDHRQTLIALQKMTTLAVMASLSPQSPSDLPAPKPGVDEADLGEALEEKAQAELKRAKDAEAASFQPQLAGRAVATEEAMRLFGPPVPRPDANALLQNALSDWRFKLYTSVV